MEIFVGPTFTIETPPSLTSHSDISECRETQVPPAFRISKPANFFAGGSSEPESSSSIGTPDNSDNEEEEVQSRNGLGSLDSLEDSLPIKKGLSSHFNGKSKSFTDLSRVTSLNELKKQENPFNKRRRVLIASKFSRKRSSFYYWSNPQSMPLLPVNEDDNDDYYEEEEKARKVPYASSSSSSSSLSEDKKQEAFPESYAAEMGLRLRSFKSRSFSLADLQEHDDEEDNED